MALFTPLQVRLEQQKLSDTKAADADFLCYARAWAKEPYSAVLLSGGNLDCSRYSIAVKNPFLIFKSKGNSSQIQTPQQTFFHNGNPLDILDRLLENFCPEFPLLVPPFTGGAVGYFAYDLKNQIERLPQTARDDLRLPDIFLFWPRHVLIHDRLQKRLCALSLRYPEDPDSEPSLFREKSLSDQKIRVGPVKSNFTHEAYLEAVRRVRHYIREGDVYQVNLSQRFRFGLQGDPFQLWESLFTINPAPFYAYIHGGDHQVLSTSMERFLYRKNSYIETRPIKGTRKRGQSPAEDERLRTDLLQSPKDDAELSMIVDLLRNDLGRVCLPRTVRVAEHKRLEAYENVYHLISIVIGQLQSEISHTDLLKATFPGGSITGCPKIRAMEIIDEMEPHVRHIYTGAIGYLGWHENLDLNVAIRTALIHQGICTFSVGGGIVYDSREEDEYQETLHKGRTLFQLIEKLGEKVP